MVAFFLLCFDGRLPGQAWFLDVTIHLELSVKKEHNSGNFLDSFRMLAYISRVSCESPGVRASLGSRQYVPHSLVFWSIRTQGQRGKYLNGGLSPSAGTAEAE
jgi:hypothetical protein